MSRLVYVSCCELSRTVCLTGRSSFIKLLLRLAADPGAAAVLVMLIQCRGQILQGASACSSGMSAGCLGSDGSQSRGSF